MSLSPSSTTQNAQHQTWTRNDGTFFISTDPTLIPLETLNNAFDSPQLDWCRRLPIQELTLMIQNSICFGIYKSPALTSTSTVTSTSSPSSSSSQPANLVGFARLSTDRVTLAYLTDVYVSPSYQSLGLGSWLIACVKEYVDTMPYLRQMVLLTKEGKNEGYYKRTLKAERMEERGAGYRFVSFKGPGSALESHD